VHFPHGSAQEVSMLFWNREAREARQFITETLDDIVSVLDECTAALNDLRFRADTVLRPRLAQGDIQKVETVIQQAEENLNACRKTLPLLQEFARSGRLSHEGFRSVKPLLLHEDEDSRQVSFDTAPQAARWLAERALEFARYVKETQIPWLEEALNYVRESASSSDELVEEANSARQEALQHLRELQSRHPQLRFSFSEELAEEMEQLWDQLQDALKRRVYSEIQDIAGRVKQTAEAVTGSAEEALAFYRDPNEKLMEGRAFLDRLEQEYRRAELELPEVFFESRRALENAAIEAKSPEPNWDEAMRLYNIASGLAQEAAALLEEGH
jgi:RNAse (barnase) inhibitor barstar